jgi:hypothetical protein
MGSAEQYDKARRNLVFFVGVLVLSILVGVTQRKSSSLSLFPFELESPQYIPHVLAVIVVYSFYNLGICWALMDEASRAARIRSTDFRVIIFFSLVFLGLYVIFELLPFLAELDVHFSAVFGWGGIVVVASALLTAFALVYFVGVRAQRRAKELQAEKESLARREHLMISLLNQDWILVFNPRMPNGKKRIKFFADGNIGDGKNLKETRWELDGEELVIWRENGDLQNRFRFDEQTSRFVSTGDPAAGAVQEGHMEQFVSQTPVPA